ncbi:MAG: hypothetical protein ABI614_21875 [Planctomycetota bacterium]
MNRWDVLLVLVTLATLGCGPSGPTTYPVKGTVTLDGTPVEAGDVIFLDAGNQLAPYAGKIQNGQFEFQSSEGKKRVEIRASRMEKLPPGQQGAMGETEAAVDYIPERYNLNSELTAEVKQGGQSDLEFPLVSK